MKVSSFALSILTGAVLLGCGGGGSDSSTPVTSTPGVTGNPVASVSRNTIESIFRLGILSSDIAALYEQPKDLYFAGAIIGASTVSSGSIPSTSIGCAGGGTATLSITKAGSYLGLRANDVLNYTFNNCRTSSTGSTVFSGSAIVTTLTTAANLDTTLNNVSNLQYSVSSTNLSITQSTTRVLHTGKMDVVLNLTPTTVALNMTVAAGSSHAWATFDPSNALSASLTVTATSGTKITKSISSNNAFTLTSNGNITSSASSGTVETEINTSTTIAGNINTTTGSLIPSSGVMNVKDTRDNVATRGTFAPLSLTISGDTDRNGTLDLTFSTVY